jgi:predicted Fe-Mo cluster-binding NifX family protein
MAFTRLAIGTADGVYVSHHLARSSSFLVFELQDGKVISETVRRRETDQCGNHKTFVELLDGCQAVICAGIGEGALKSLTAHAIQPLVLAKPCAIREALAGYLAGSLETTGELVCLCHEPTTP